MYKQKYNIHLQKLQDHNNIFCLAYAAKITHHKIKVKSSTSNMCNVLLQTIKPGFYLKVKSVQLTYLTDKITRINYKKSKINVQSTYIPQRI